MNPVIQEFIGTYIAIYSRYLVIAFAFYILYYDLLKEKVKHKKIQLRFPSFAKVRSEFFYSTLSVLFMAATSVPFFVGPLQRYSQVYYDISAMPLWYTIASFFIMMIVHDTYFYWMHRTMHHPSIFKRVHLVHHKSTNPTPWTAYSFHPTEAFFESLIGPIILLIMPIHMGVFVGFFIFQIVYNIYGHSGYEFFPKGFNKHWFGRWINTSVHHNLHHHYFDNSYGLYFTFWDRVMGTMHPEYDNTYEEVDVRRNKV